MAQKLRIVFMGTPDFAIPALRELSLHHNVVCVVTNPDKPKGRGGKLNAPPVKEFALNENIDVLQPSSVKTDEFLELLKAYNADLFVTAAYGKILPARLLTIPELGCINIHASLLPKYRGAAPIWHCIINGEKESGITIMMTDAGMDTGDILLVKKVEIPIDMTTGELHDVLAEEGRKLIADTIKKLQEGTLKRIPQNNDEATYAPMVNRDTGLIDWTKSAFEIHNLVRGTNPFPGSYTYFENKEKLKIWKTELIDYDIKNKENGEIIDINSQGAIVKTGRGLLKIVEVQGESSKRMHIWSYKNGHPIILGTKFIQEVKSE